MDKTVEVSQAARDAAEEPFAHFQWNESWGVWEQVRPECASDPNVVAAYRLPTTRATQPEAALREALERIDIQALEREAGEALDAWDQEHGLSYGACFSIVSGIILAALKDHRHG